MPVVLALPVCEAGGGDTEVARGRRVAARPGRIYFASFPKNRLALSICGWKPNVGHASLLTKDSAGRIAQYDYGWFVGYNGARPSDAIGYVDASESYAASPAPTRRASERRRRRFGGENHLRKFCCVAALALRTLILI